MRIRYQLRRKRKSWQKKLQKNKYWSLRRKQDAAFVDDAGPSNLSVLIIAGVCVCDV
jgi:hypothetical protein